MWLVLWSTECTGSMVPARHRSTARGRSWLAAMLPNSDDLSISVQARSLRGKGRSKLWHCRFCLKSETQVRNEALRNGWNEWVNISNYSYFSHVFSNSWPKALFFLVRLGTHPETLHQWCPTCQAHARSLSARCRMAARRRWWETSR